LTQKTKGIDYIKGFVMVANLGQNRTVPYKGVCAMSSDQSSSTVVEATPVGRVAELDLRSLLLFCIFRCGGYGLCEKEIESKLGGYTTQDYVSLYDADKVGAAINELLKSGVITRRNKQWGTCDFATFLELAPGTTLVAK